MFVSVRNTFFHEIVDLQAIESGDEQMRRRAKSVGSVLLQGQEVIALEQASISSLKEWFGRSRTVQEQAPVMMKSFSNSSLSTMCMEGDSEVDSFGEEVHTLDHACLRVEQEFEAQFGSQHDDAGAGLGGQHCPLSACRSDHAFEARTVDRIECVLRS